VTKLGALVEQGELFFSDGYRTKRAELSDAGYVILRAADIVDNRVELEGADHVDSRMSRQIGSKVAKEGDVILTTKGSVGRTALVKDLDGRDAVYSPQVCYFRFPEGSVLVAQYLQYWFASSEGRRQIRMYSGNTDMAPYLSLRDIAELDVKIPRRSEQAAVCEVLGALDDKIAANGALVSSAESLRRTAWLRATRGAELAPLSSFAQFVNGGAYTKGATGTGRVVIRIAELNSGISASTVYNDLEVPDRQVAHAGDLLMSWSGSLTAVRWYRDDAIVNQHIFKVIPREGHPLWAVACAVETKLDEFREIAAGKATTMGHIERADLDSPVAWPEVSACLNGAGTALWERALAAERENLRLSATRDELVPLLMSGKVTLKDAEKAVEEVV